MTEQDEQTDRTKVVGSSIKKLKTKFVPGIKISLIFSAILGFSMLIVGCLNVHKCPINKNIPLFLIATGAVGLMSKFVTFVRERISKHVQVVYFESALYSVETIFFFLGTYWVYREFQPSYNPEDGLYCNKTAYIFAFVYVTIFYAVIIAAICGFCCFICCALCLVTVAKADDTDVENAPKDDDLPKDTVEVKL